MPQANQRVRLIVFADDWGRHPSSCQHLVSRLLPQYPTLWVNTIGTRAPRLSWDDLGKIAAKLRQWAGPRQASDPLPNHLDVISPRMWPGFRTSWQRALNRRWVSHAVNRRLDQLAGNSGELRGERRVVLTTLPITADLVGAVRADRWVYYCVDDFSVWPGLDSQVMQTMERQLVSKVDAAAAVSRHLQQHLGAMGRSSTLLTHGIDLEHWQNKGEASAPDGRYDSSKLPAWAAGLPRPIYLFWGLLDQRLDVDWCRSLVESQPGSLVLVGPRQQVDNRLDQLAARSDGSGGSGGSGGSAPHPASPASGRGDRRISGGGRLVMPGPVNYQDLPILAAWADVLVMPYADLPVTAAMQPLKFKEYLATGKPVVARALESVRDWADAADLVSDVSSFVQAVGHRAKTGVDLGQQAIRQRRLADESWERKALILESLLRG